MARLTLEQAKEQAPVWATHISVCRWSGIPEYYNALDGTMCLSIPIKTPDNPPARLWGFWERFIGGDTMWEAVEIAPVSLLNE